MSVSSDSDDSVYRISPLLKGYPIIGNIPHFLKRPFAFLEETTKNYPKEVVRLKLGPAEVLYSAQADHTQYILSTNWKNFIKGPIVKPLRLLMGEGLVTSDIDVWLRSRRIMQPVFTAKKIETLAEPMVEIIDESLSELKSLAGQDIEIGEELMQCTQRVMMRLMFGTNTPREEGQIVWKSLRGSLKAINIRLFLYFVPKFIPLPGAKMLRDSVQRIDDIVLGVVNKRRRSAEIRNDLLSLLLAARDDETNTGMSDRQLRDELVTAFIAGIETTALAVSWLWHELDKNPACRQTLLDEVRQVLGQRLPTYADLANLNYTRMAFMEAMRLYPPAWFLARAADHDDEIGGYPISAGTNILMSPYVTHRMSEYWERPQSFYPEHFLPAAIAQRHKFAYLPFGAGPRACIGIHFAYMEGLFIIAMMAQRFRFSSVAGHVVEPASVATLRPKHGIRMHMTLSS